MRYAVWLNGQAKERVRARIHVDQHEVVSLTGSERCLTEKAMSSSGTAPESAFSTVTPVRRLAT
jgi:hypothetical protein